MAAPFPKIASHDDVLEAERTPLAERWRPSSSFEVISATAERRPAAPALTFLMEGSAAEKGVAWSYAELLAEIARAANLFRALGAGPDAPVALILPNAPETHFALWGAETAAAAAPINPLLEPAQMAGLLRSMRARVVVTLAPLPGVAIHEKAMAAVAEAPDVAHVLTVDLTRYLSPLKRLAARLIRKRAIRAKGAETADFGAASAAQSATLAFPPPAPDAVCSLFHTGGTTGDPKVARHTHANETFDAWVVAHYVQLEDDAVALCGLPLFHVNAAILTGLAVFTIGGHVLLATPQGYRSQRLRKDFWRIIERWRVAFFSGVPTLYAALLAEESAGCDLSSLRFAVCGAAPMPVDLIRKFEAKTGLRIIEGYGLTEATCVSAAHPRFGAARPGSVGLRLPYQEMKVAISDGDGRILRDAEPDEPGVIVMRGPHVFPGYLDPADDAGVWFEGGWLNTGDLGRRDADGYFWITGRAKDLIIRGGHNIDPQIVEEALARHPAVALAAAVGQPDAYAGELPAAYVALREGAAATVEELTDFARAEIPERAAVPAHLEILPELPMTAVGKVYKPELRRRAAERVLAAALAAAGVENHGLEVRLDPKSGLRAHVSGEQARAALGGFAIAVD